MNAEQSEAVGTDETNPYVDAERPSARPGFWTPESIVDLEWCLMRIGELQAQVAENEAIYKAMVARYRDRTDAINKTPLHGIEWFTGLVHYYCEQHRDQLLKHGKAKSRKLQSGTIGWRKVGGRPVIEDKQALCEWALAQPVTSGFVRVKEEPDWSAIKEHVEKTGELLPGVIIEPEVDQFEFKVLKLNEAS